VREVKFNLWVDTDHQIGPNRPAYVGYITQIRPEVAVIAGCRPAEFEYVWSLHQAPLQLGVGSVYVLLE
jgi:hypothetical protein